MSNHNYSSHSIRLGARLLAASGAVAGLLLIQGCDKRTTESGVYQDAQQCAAAEIFTPKYCNDHFREAQAQNEKLAPHYQSQEDCEKDWGYDNCDQKNGGNTTMYYHGGGYAGGYYSPHMNGYWTGYTETPPKTAGAQPTRQYFSYPTYKGKDGAVYSPATNQTIDASGKVTTAPDFDTAKSVTTAPRPSFNRGSSFSEGTISRGGFGESAHGFGFGAGE